MKDPLEQDILIEMGDPLDEEDTWQRAPWRWRTPW